MSENEVEVEAEAETEADCINQSCEDVGKETTTKDYFRWTPESTRYMLTLRFKRHKEFLTPLQPKNRLWNEISLAMHNAGYQVSGYLCNLKFRSLLQTYRKNREKDLNGLEWQINWEYYEMFKKHIEKKYDTKDTKPLQLDNSPNAQTTICKEDTEKTDGTQFETTTTPPQHIYPFRDNHYDNLSSNSSETTNNGSCIMRSNGNTQSESPLASPQQPSNTFERRLSPHDELIQSNLLTPEISMKIGEKLCNEESSNSFIKTDFDSFQKAAELNECRVFGESIGYQLSTIKDDKCRALAQFKIQELIYKAKVGTIKE